MERPLASGASRIMHTLRLGVAQLIWLETPPHAAVHSAVEMTKQLKMDKFSGLVNAVLRRVSESGAATLEALDGPRLDTPSWLWTAWSRDARAIARAQLIEAPLDLSLRAGSAPPELAEPLPTGSWRMPAGTRVTELPGFEAGTLWVQDAAAALPARLLAAQKGERIADLCAAPGGKTAQLADTGAMVTAIESNPTRLARLRENLERLHLEVETIQADAITWRPPALLDAVLLDAPCSATGTIRRHPDVAHLKRPRDIQGLVAQQDRLLEAASEMLRPGGRLIYAVCSMQPEEGPARIAQALQKLKLRAQPFTPAELPGLGEAITADGHIRTTPAMWPEHGGMDGFFIARMIRE